MNEIYIKDKRIVCLSVIDVIDLHHILCANYDELPEMEKVSPPGVKNINMLESAVSRQHVGTGDYYKYDDIFINCATLVFGLVKNHAFHNGNKRLGFLAMIKHLLLNGYVIKPGVTHIEIFDLLRLLASNELIEHAITYGKHFYKQNKKEIWTDELQIEYIGWWLRKSTIHKNNKYKQNSLSINELQRILEAKNFETGFSGKFLRVAKKKTIVQILFNTKPLKRDYIVKDSKNISQNLVAQIREDFSVRFIDGVDNQTFYDDKSDFREEIVLYKKIIYKLAKT